MRVELFAKDLASLASHARTVVSLGATGLNVPQKSKADVPLRSLQTLQAALPAASLHEVVPHYSLKFSYGGSRDNALSQFESFCTAAHAMSIRQCLLVSGSGSRSFDSLTCLQSMSLSEECVPDIGVAFNPFFPDESARKHERARLRDKVATGRVSAVWLQIGSDVRLLSEGLAFVRHLSDSAPRPLRIYGSVFVPSRQLLAQQKFRPWNGVFLSASYLDNVAAGVRMQCCTPRASLAKATLVAAAITIITTICPPRLRCVPHRCIRHHMATAKPGMMPAAAISHVALSAFGRSQRRRSHGQLLLSTQQRASKHLLRRPCVTRRSGIMHGSCCSRLR